MPLLKVAYPVYTLDNQLLVSENTRNVSKTIDMLISSKSHRSYKTCSLSRHGTIKKDLIDFLSEPNYRIIFSDQKKTDAIMDVLGHIRLISPILQSFDYFKDRDFYTYRHILVVFALSTLLAMDLLTEEKDLLKEFLAGPIHDFGKICVPVDILKKTEPLTQREKSMLEHHTVAGYILLSYYYRNKHNFFCQVARDHHERRNGSGYPRGIKLRDWMVEIIAISDVYDALISQRPYRPVPYDNRTAIEEITMMAERNQLSWNIVKAFVALNRKSKPHFSVCNVSREKRGTPPPENKYGIIIQETI